MRILNCTPHPISLYDRALVDDSNPRRLMLPNDACAVMHLTSAGISLNAVRGEHILNAEASKDLGVPVYNPPTFVSYDELPPEYTDYYVVSRMYKQAVSDLGGDTSKLLTVGETVFKPDSPTPVGCCSFEL